MASGSSPSRALCAFPVEKRTSLSNQDEEWGAGKGGGERSGGTEERKGAKNLEVVSDTGPPERYSSNSARPLAVRLGSKLSLIAHFQVRTSSPFSFTHYLRCFKPQLLI
ncbi:hypothetical protein Tco_0790536 [Tanacetum coccineum]